MKYQENDLFLIEGVEARVGFVDARGNAYMTPLHDGDHYNFKPTLVGLVFCVLDNKGRDKNTGVKAFVLNNSQCGAV